MSTLAGGYAGGGADIAGSLASAMSHDGNRFPSMARASGYGGVRRRAEGVAAATFWPRPPVAIPVRVAVAPWRRFLARLPRK